MYERLFAPIGMQSALPRFDDAGTFIGSSFCFATARDFARFGLLYLRDGQWDGCRLLPKGWVDYARTPTFQQADCVDGPYGAHWWLDLAGPGSFSANGYEGPVHRHLPRSRPGYRSQWRDRRAQPAPGAGVAVGVGGAVCLGSGVLQFLASAFWADKRFTCRLDLLAASDPARRANVAGRKRSRRATLRAMQVGKLKMHPLSLRLEAMHLRVKAHLLLPQTPDYLLALLVIVFRTHASIP